MLVIGLRHGAGEGAVAAALAAVLRSNLASLGRGLEPRVERLFESDLEASPVVAARHRGETLDPAAVADSLRDEAVIAAVGGGGLLAPVTRNFSVRDLAAELRRPVILVTPAGADATNLVRLSLAAARAARLVVPAVVLTRWPDPPDRVQLDERRLLGELAGTDVRTLPESPSDRADAVRDWPVLAWLEAAPPAPEPEPVRERKGTVPSFSPARPTIELEPYVAWPERTTGDPRATPRPRIMEALLEVVAAEGPIVAQRAYGLYNRASGGKKLTTTARAPLSSAMHWLHQERKVVLEDDVARLPDQPAVRVRALGDRVLEEVPLDEIAELMRRLGGPDKRGVLTAYGLVRLTQRADEHLSAAIERL